MKWDYHWMTVVRQQRVTIC